MHSLWLWGEGADIVGRKLLAEIVDPLGPRLGRRLKRLNEASCHVNLPPFQSANRARVGGCMHIGRDLKALPLLIELLVIHLHGLQQHRCQQVMRAGSPKATVLLIMRISYRIQPLARAAARRCLAAAWP